MAVHRILVINPRTNFTKIAVFDDNKLVFLNKVMHPQEDIAKFLKIIDQHEYRKNIIIKELENADIDLKSITVVVGRGGLVKPLKSGVYEVNDTLINDLVTGIQGHDSVNLGGLIASDIAKIIGVKSYISDPVVVDEMSEIAKVSGHPLFERKSIFHALNQKAIARTHAKSISKQYSELNLIVVHLGVGISVGAHHKGRVIDVNQGLDGNGPFSPKRTGTLPVGDLIKLCYSGKYSEDEMMEMVTTKGGLVAYFGTEDVALIEQKAHNGDAKAKLILEAMAYQISKEIGAISTVLYCNVDAILISGGIANSKWIVSLIRERVEKIAPVHVFPGGDEMEALASNVLEALKGEQPVLFYK